MNLLAPLAARLKLRGDLEIRVYDVNRRRASKADPRPALRDRLVIRNTITFDGAGSLIRLLAQDGITAADWQLATLRAGSNATPPTRADAALGAQVISKALSAGNRVQSLPTGELIIQATLATTDAVGAFLREAGVFHANGVLFARQVHPEIEKTSGITVSYTWRFGVTV